jgi:predicted enzyme related to lactoylglutathione lyase
MKAELLKHGRFSWNELLTTAPEAAKGFYAKLFGWEYEMFPSEAMTYHVIKSGGEEIGGIMQIPPQAKGQPPVWGIYVTVDNVDETVKLAEILGGKIHVPPTDIPKVGRFAVLRDPQGAFISVITYRME